MTTSQSGRRLVLATAALLLATSPGEGHTAPRKAHRPAPTPGVVSRDIETDTTGTIQARQPSQQATTASATSQDDEKLPTPFRLPAASRTRMRDCGLKWQAMKMSGEAGDGIWRAFATGCLAAADGPFDKRSNH